MKNILLSGASGGLGLHLAKKLLEENYFVILHYYQNASEVLKLHQEYPDQTICIQADLRNEEEIYKIQKFLKNKNIFLDVLINNAAIDHVSDLDKKDFSTFLNVFSLNTLAPFLLMKLFGNEINERGGAIVNISSDNTLDKYDPRTMEYDVSKSGLNILAKDFALEYPNAHINTLLFGWLDTSMNDIPEDMKKFISFVSLDRAVDEILKMINSKETGKVKVIQK